MKSKKSKKILFLIVLNLKQIIFTDKSQLKIIDKMAFQESSITKKYQFLHIFLKLVKKPFYTCKQVSIFEFSKDSIIDSIYPYSIEY